MIKKKIIYVLVACEESQSITRAFRKLGHAAYSCDLQSCPSLGRGGKPQWHIKADCRPFLSGGRGFYTMDGCYHIVPKWDLIIAHPPCTYISRMGAKHMYQGGKLNKDRFSKMQDAVAFFHQCLNANAKYVCVENPIPLKIAMLPKPSTYFQPWWFGAPYTKKTLLWLKNLPPLMPTIENSKRRQFHALKRGKYRSRTLPQVAVALSEQYSQFVLKDMGISV